MSNNDLRTPIIYILTFIIVVLLIVLKKADDRNKEKNLSDIKEKIETRIDEEIDKKIIKDIKPKYKGRIGLIIDDFGYRNDDVSDGFLNLNANITFAVIPGHRYSTSFSKKAIEDGFEVIVHMPMENTGKTYGEEEFVLMTNMDSETIERRIRNAIKQIPTAVGLNNHQGSKASADQKVMSNVARVLKEKNLFFIDSRTTVETIGEMTMELFGVPTARRNIFLDNEDDEDKILEQLNKLIKRSERVGFAIGIGHVKPKTLNVLKKHIPILKKEGYKFDFVSTMLH